MYYLNLIKKRLIDAYPILRRVLKVNYGLLPDEEDERDYIMGASDDKINWKVIKPDGNWLPEAEQMIHEIQKGRLFDTMGCTGYALNNVIEMLALAKWNEVWNKSDRYPNKGSNTSRSGNSMKRLCQFTKNYGMVDEASWSWNRDKFNWNEYYKPIPQRIFDEGERWKKTFTFGYDGVWATKSMIIEALKYSPLYVAAYAWYRKGMLYYSVSSPNHATTIISRDKYICYDSYSPHIKHLDEGFKIYYVKRIYLEKKDAEYNVKKIKEFKNKRPKATHIMRVNAKGQIHILNDKLEHVDGDKYLTEKLKDGFANGQIVPVSEKDYYSLIG